MFCRDHQERRDYDRVGLNQCGFDQLLLILSLEGGSNFGHLAVHSSRFSRFQTFSCEFQHVHREVLGGGMYVEYHS